MNTEEAQKLLARYKDHQCTPAEKEKLEAWFDQLSQSGDWDWQSMDKTEFGEHLKKDIDNRINQPKKSHLANLKWIAVAASVFLVSGTILFAVKNKNWLYNKPGSVAYTELYAPPGHRVKITLKDGSTVLLNGSSRLRYPVEFDGPTREVSLLEGEGYFDIHHDDKKMFVVEALGTHTYVLGTAFNIRAYKVAREVQITVTRGKVAVKGLENLKMGSTQPFTLLPDDQVTIVKATGNMIQRHINAADYTVWVQGRYKFNNESLGNVAIVLENSFNIHVSFISEDIKNIRFSSEFEHTDKLEDLLFAICKANNLAYVIKGRDVILKQKYNQ
jgi:transmembrane sensor